MPNLNVPFAGQTLIIPGAYYADNVSNAQQFAPITTPPLVFIGYGYGQKPFIPTTYDNPNDLLTAIRGGPCSGYVSFLTSPSPQLQGAQQVTYINVGENTQSSLTLKSGTSGVIIMTSTNYGLPSNQLQAQVAAGALAGKAVTLYDGFSGASYTGQNLGVPFQLAYTGAATGVTYSTVVSGGVATNFVIGSPNAGESVNVPLNAYNTITQLVQYLNGTGFYNAQVISNGALPSSNLDAAASGALSSGFANVPATLGDIVYWLNSNAGSLVTAVSSGTSSTAVAPTNIPLTLFSGATSVPPTLADYASGFNAALAIPGWAVFADSNASGVVALGTQHAITACLPQNGKFRRFFSGSSIGDTVAAVIARAQSMDAIQATYVYPGIYAINTSTGLNTLYGGLYAAAAVAGMATGNGPSTPLTNKALTGTGLEVKLTVSQIDQLQQSGVMPLWIPQQTGVPTVVSDLTTWQIDSNPENVFNQQVACRHYLAYTILNTLQPYVGTQADPLTETKILNAVKSALNALMYNSGNANGVLVSWNPSTLTLVYNGQNQVAAINVAVVFVGQNRFITCTVDVLPLSIILSAA